MIKLQQFFFLTTGSQAQLPGAGGDNSVAHTASRFLRILVQERGIEDK